MLTESNVANATRRGEEVAEIEAWLTSTVPWPDERSGAVAFDGYVATFACPDLEAVAF